MNRNISQIGSTAESCWGDEQRELHLLPGQILCDCGEVVEPDERRECAHCGHKGCVHCLQRTSDPDGDEYVCGDECEVAWYEEIQRSAQATCKMIQDEYGKLIEAVRLRKAG